MLSTLDAIAQQELGQYVESNVCEQVCVIQHPSTGFSYEEVNPVFQKALLVAGNGQ